MKNTSLSRVLLATLVLLTLKFNVFAQIPTAGLIGYWDFSGDANDVSGNNLNGVVDSATLTTDRFGIANSAYHFNGRSSSITVPHNQILNAYPLTINFWFKTTQQKGGAGGEDYRFISKYQAGTNNGYSINTMGGHRLVPKYCTIGRGNCGTGFSTNPTNGQWHMGTVIFTTTTIDIYIDNILDDSSPLFNTQVTTNIRDLLFGKSDNATPHFYEGDMDEIGIWNRALNQSERTGLFTASITGMSERAEKLSAVVYPNPATDQITINSKSSVVNSPYSISDLTGRVVLTGKFKSESLSIEKLPKGIYVLKVGDQQQLFKVIKQ